MPRVSCGLLSSVLVLGFFLRLSFLLPSCFSSFLVLLLSSLSRLHVYFETEFLLLSWSPFSPLRSSLSLSNPLYSPLGFHGFRFLILWFFFDGISFLFPLPLVCFFFHLAFCLFSLSWSFCFYISFFLSLGSSSDLVCSPPLTSNALVLLLDTLSRLHVSFFTLRLFWLCYLFW